MGRFKMSRISQGVAAFGLLIAAACGRQDRLDTRLQEAWNFQNDPLQLDERYERDLSRLPNEGSLKWAPWPDSYWPSQQGGIAARWRTGESGFWYRSPNLNELRAMSLRDRSLLSPAEKYDAFRGVFSYPMVMSERNRTSPNAQAWEGLCHGWAQASYLFQEPSSVVVRSADGVDIPFGAADIKALLAILQGQYARTEVRSLGGRCNADFRTNPNAASVAECRDVNAGAFHLVLTNRIGLQKKGFVADVTRDQQVWNHPVYSYKSSVIGYQGPSAGASPRAVKEALVRTTMTYTIEIAQSWDLVFPNSGRYVASKVYDYRLELDAQGQIVGGEWLSGDRPDFLWTQQTAPMTGSWTPLKTIYDASIRHGQAFPDPLF